MAAGLSVCDVARLQDIWSATDWRCPQRRAGTATVLLLYLIAERLFGRLAARIAAGLFAVLPGPIFFTGLFMSETMFVFLPRRILALVLSARATVDPVGAWRCSGVGSFARGEGFLRRHPAGRLVGPATR